MKTILIRGEEYVEVKPQPLPSGVFEVCLQCAFHQSASRCWEAVDKSPEVFGGDCDERDVVYQPALKGKA
jgi:hypothetical protein